MQNLETIIEIFPDQVIKQSNQGTVVLGRLRATGEDVVVKLSQEFKRQHDTVDHRAGDRLHVLRELRILPQLLGISGVPQFLASDRVKIGAAIAEAGPAAEGKGAPVEQFRLAMSKIDGIDFEERRKQDPKRRLSCDEAIDFLKQTAAILQQVHVRGIIHRDLKLSNFMITEAGRIFVVDWGTAKEINNQTGLPGQEELHIPTLAGQSAQAGLSKQTSSPSKDLISVVDDPDVMMGRTPEHTVIGTVQFVSYEQITGQALDERTDVYSLGAVTALLRYGPQITQRYTIDANGKIHNREKRDIAKAVAAAETLKYEIMPAPNTPEEATLQQVLKGMTHPDRHLRLQNMQAVLDRLATSPSHIE